MYNKNDTGDKENLSKSTSDDKYLPIDPGNQSEIGQKVETPIVKKNEGISEQSAKWEDVQERGIPNVSILPAEAERYLKNPSPAEMETENKDEKGSGFLKDGERTPPPNNPEDQNV